jgi:arginine/lysine/histidine/glutamine transport system substrate-binding/permease protein
MTITPERMESVAFSRPYFKSGLAIAVREDTQNITSLADLKGKRIAVKLGTTGSDMAAQVPNAELVTFDSTEMSLQELANGNVSAVINDAPATLGLLATGKVTGVKLAGPLLTEEYYGIGLPPESPNKPFVDQAITDLIADGTYATLYRKWFAAEPPTIPDTFPQTTP